MNKYILTLLLLVSYSFMQGQTYTLGGTVKTAHDDGVGEVELQILDADANVVGTYFTDCTGNYTFDNLQEGASYTLQVIKEGSPLNGNSAFDLVMIRRHLLGVSEFDNPYSLTAADMDESGQISVLDILWLQLVILAIEDGFPGSNWFFFRPGESAPQSSYEIMFTNDVLDYDLIGVKKGDVNDSAQACQ